MPFAIKLTRQITTDYGQVTVEEKKYYSQTIEHLTKKGFAEMILLTDGVNAEEVDISKSLVEARIKAEKITRMFPQRVRFNKTITVIKIVEFPEVIEHD